MLILVAYDIQTVTEKGRARLREAAKACEAVGRRVQNSVFECPLDAAQLRHFQEKMNGIIDPKVDSVRYYNLGNRYEGRILCQRQEDRFSYNDPLIL